MSWRLPAILNPEDGEMCIYHGIALSKTGPRRMLSTSDIRY